jgi:hypothetical protein
MNPQGSSIINTEQIDSLKARVESCNTCEQLQEVTTSVMETVDAEKDAILAQIEKLAPIAALTEVPTDPQKVIDWITGFINDFLKPMLTPSTTYQLQLTAITAASVDLIDTINKKKNEIASCSIDFPV